MNSSGICVYVINLDRSKERFDALLNRLRGVTFPIVRIPAVDGRQLQREEFLRLTSVNRFKHPLIPTEVGCYLSHLRVLESFLASDHTYAVVLEDDAVPDERFEQFVRLAIADHEEHPLWDILKLNGRRKSSAKLRTFDTGLSLVTSVTPPSRTVAQIWTRLAAEHFTARFHGICRPIDVDLFFLWEHGIRIASCEPEIVRHSGSTSEIGSRRYSKGALRKLWYQVNFNYHRLLWMLRQSNRTG